MVERIKEGVSNTSNVFWLLISGIAMCLAMYVFFVSNTIYTVVKIQSNEKAVSTIQSEIQKLEVAYFDLKNNVNSELAKSKGFILASNPQYISKKTLGKGISMRNEI